MSGVKLTSEFQKLDRHHVQWAAQFATAAELCKLCYSVSFTMGNATPIADLLVMAPSGATFSIDVKGQSTKNFWRIKQKVETPNLFYVLCLVGAPGQGARFFVLPQPDLIKLMREYEMSGVKFDPSWSGINWGACIPYEGRWDLLPD